MKDPPKPDKRRKYDAAFRAEALRLAEQSRSTQAAARALNIDPKLLLKWQRDAQPALPASPTGRKPAGQWPCSPASGTWLKPKRR